MGLIKFFVVNVRRSPTDVVKFLVTVFILSASAVTFVANLLMINKY